MTRSGLENSVPRDPETAQSRLAKPVAGRPAAPHPYGILVVDTEKNVRDALSVELRQRGYVVWLAAGDQEALGVYRQHSRAIDLVLMDMAGLDGPRVLVALQKLNPGICCCFMSEKLGPHAQERLCDVGAAAFIRKPVDPNRLSQVIQDLADNPDWSRASV